MTESVSMVQTLLDHLQTLPGLVGLLIGLVLTGVVGLNLRESARLRRLTARVRSRVEPAELAASSAGTVSSSPKEPGWSAGMAQTGGIDESSPWASGRDVGLDADVDWAMTPESVPLAEPSFGFGATPAVRVASPERLHRDLSVHDEWLVTLDGFGLEQVSHELILAQFKDWHRCGQKTVRFGLDGQDRLVVALLLVTRQGGLSLNEYNQFYDRLAAGLSECPGVDSAGFMAQLPDFSVCHARSRERLRTLEALDGQLVFHLQSDHPASTQNTAAFLSAMGLSERAEGRFSRLDEHSEAIFSVLPGDQGFNLSFMLDLPRVSHPTQAFSDLVDLAQACAEAFSGRLVDDAGRPLTSALFEQFAQQVASRDQALTAAGLTPGGWLNRKIFS
ncbi:MAG: cell division protein ZipA C-terminal FtsZ-binding domain-containing protein [Burkholderiaceae bacterium]